MTQNEWEQKTGHMPTPEQWATIHTVYTFHPSIPDVGGQDQIAKLFTLGGMALLSDMLPRAERHMEIERRIQQISADLIALEAEKKEVLREFNARSMKLQSEQAGLLREEREARGLTP